MTSAINPNNIDGTYPVAGQDNNSQGFRDNFTNIKTNFQFAEDEITDLQTNAVVKNANNNLNGSGLSNAVLNDMGYQFLDLQTPSNPTVTINYEVGQYQAFQTSQAFNLAFSNFPPAGVAGEVYVRVNVTNVSHTMTLPSAVSQGLTGIQGISGQVITFRATGIYNFRFTTTDGGTTVTVYDLNRPLNVYTNPLFLAVPDTYSGTGNVSLTSTTTLFSSNAAVTGNLLAGQVGQIKILAYSNVSVGNTQITVTNAAWGGSNIANLSAVGSACTLQWIGAKWFAIGNNGVTFT
jgi:hypothetical protein